MSSQVWRRVPKIIPSSTLRLPSRYGRLSYKPLQALKSTRQISQSLRRREPHHDSRLDGLVREITDDYAALRSHYDAPKHPIVLAHGLLGFAELKLAGSYLPTLHYWHGIKEALNQKGTTVLTATVPPSSSIQERAAALGRDIAAKAGGKSVNIVAHSMGGLDTRYMISHLQPNGVDVKSLVTVSTPHHGSAFADYVIEGIGPDNLPRLYHLWERSTGMGTGAFAQLTKKYMETEFNPSTPDDPSVRYFSYGAAVKGRPSLLNPFRQSHRILAEMEGLNDGLVSVESSKWGTYKGTLIDVNHLDLINWGNKLKYTVGKWMGQQQSFNAVAFYLDIADMLAKEGF